MLSAETLFTEMINNPVRRLHARVEILEGSELLEICKCGQQLKEFTVERVGDESKFFGYGICQRLNVHFIDINRKRSISTANTLDIAFGVGADYIHPYPYFYVSEVHRNENTNELSVTAYDALYQAATHKISDIGFNTYTIREFAAGCGAALGVAVGWVNIPDAAINTFYSAGANFSGNETIREALDALAEATQAIYYINNDGVLTFRRLDIDGPASLTIDRGKYFTLDSGDSKRLKGITHVTELGDNVSAALSITGTVQYVRNNPFWDLRDDVGTLVDNALAAAGGLTVNQFVCTWRGNFLCEIGDKVALITKDGAAVTSYMLNDTLSYDGTLSEKTSWKYSANDAETESNPTSISEAISQTYARVDKANKQIELVVSETSENTENLTTLLLDNDSLNMTVQQLQADTSAALDEVNESIGTLTNKVEAAVTAEDVSISIQQTLADGVSSVTTETGYKLNADGLSINKSGSEMTTLISEDGMRVYKDEDEVLTANNEGVNAVNLHASTYLIVGNNSRFEDYDNNRTGCFWLGGGE